MSKYKIIYADCPWQYDNAKNNDPASGGITYETMPSFAIAEIPVYKIAAPDSVLFMWVTWPKLEDALTVMSAWGFTYTTCAFVWIKLDPNASIKTLVPAAKTRRDLFGGVGIEGREAIYLDDLYSGLGHWTNGNTEFVLFGRRGRAVKRQDKSVKQVIIAPRGRHSAKPAAVRRSIERLVGIHKDAGPRVELFARERSPGWDAVGNEIDGRDIREVIK